MSLNTQEKWRTILQLPIKSTAKIILLVLLDETINQLKDAITISALDLAVLAGLGERTTYRTVKELKRLGFLDTVLTDDITNTYTINWNNIYTVAKTSR